MMPSLFRERPEFSVILILFAVLGTTYSITTPVFEASDEIAHYPVVEHIATTGSLPVQVPGVETLWEQEGSQPPLYYLAAAGLTFWVDTSDLEQIRWRNPHAKLGVPLDPDNTNMVIHTEAEAFPWTGTVLAVHIARLFSVVLGCVSVFLSYLLVREVWSEARWVHALSVALVAYNPMFLFITGSVNNDNMMILLGTWILLLCARIVRNGITRQRGLTLGLVAALATLTKISGWTFMPLIGLVLLIHVWQNDWVREAWLRSINTGLSMIGAWLVLSGWWYLRNWRLYNEFFGTNTHVEIVGGRSIGFIEAITNEWFSFWVAYWGWFGAVNILYPQLIYLFFAAIQILAAVGLLYLLTRDLNPNVLRTKWLIPGLLAFQTIVVVGGIIRWTMTTMGSQGRLLFPVVGGVSALTAIGLLAPIPEKYRRGGAIGLSTSLLLIAAVTPFLTITPAYQPPETVDVLPQDAIALEAHYGPLELVGIETTTPEVEPGGWLPFTVYWRLNEQTGTDYSAFFSVVGRDVVEIGKLDTYPGAGTLPTSRMEPGLIYQDRYTIQVDEEFEYPTAIRVLVGVGIFEGADVGYTNILEPTTQNGQEVGSVITTVGVGYPTGRCDLVEPVTSDGPDARGQFADLAIVDGAVTSVTGSQVDLALRWQTIGTTPDDWTIFVHLLDEAGQLVAQADGPPLNGDYPTSLWSRECYYPDNRQLEIPADAAPGQYEVHVGMYNAADPTLPRIPVVDGSDSVLIGTITIGDE